MGLDKKRIKDAFLLVLMIAAVFCYISCGSSSDDDDDDDDVNTALTVSGTAAKGLISGGVVSIHPIIDGVLSNTPIASSTTDANGDYSATINNYDGNPFIVRVTTTATTTMRCDLPEGCGDGSAFGDDVTLNDSSFNLDAVVPPIPTTQTNTSVNLSVLTTTASEVALNTLNSSPSTDISTLINNANTAVANRFGLTGNVTQLPVVDLTNPASLVGVAQDVIQYNLLSVGVVETQLSGNNASTIAQALSNFATQFSTQGGIADTETAASSNVTLTEILSAANQVADSVRNAISNAGGSTENLEQLQSTLNQAQQQAQNGSTTPTGGTPDTGTGSSGGTID